MFNNVRKNDRQAPGLSQVSRDDIVDRLAKVDVQTLVTGNLKASRIQPELMEDGRVDVGNVVPILNSMESQFVGRPVYGATLDATAGQPNRKSIRVMIAPIGILRPWRAAKFGGPNNQRFIEHPPPLQILQ